MLTREDPLGHTTTLTYDAVGNLSSREDANGAITTYTYDDNDRLLTEAAPDRTVAFSYDPHGNRLTMADANGTSTYVYDALNRLERATDAFGKTVEHGYDPAGNRTSLTYPTGDVVTYGFDPLNRMGTVLDWIGGTTTYTYDDAGRLVHTEFPNGSTVDTSIDAAGRVDGLTNLAPDSSLISDYSFTLDPVGNIVGEARNEPLAPTFEGISEAYTYDDANRIQTRTTDLGNSTIYTHDDSGSLIHEAGPSADETYIHDPRSQLVTHTQDSSIVDHVYDGLGQRVARIDDASESRFVLDTLGDLYQTLQETAADGTTITSYVYGLGLISQVDPSDIVHFHHYDFRGSTVAISGATGGLTKAFAFDPFGTVAGSTGSSDSRFGFTGRSGVMSENEDLLFVRARHYNTDLGRFMQRDPLDGLPGDPQTWNAYPYARNNAIGAIDEDGEAATLLTGGVGFLVGGVVGGGLELFNQTVIQGRDRGDVDWGKVAGRATSGAITGGVAGLTGGASLAVGAGAAFGAGALGEAAGSAVEQMVHGVALPDISIDPIEVVAAGAINTASFGAGRALTSNAGRHALGLKGIRGPKVPWQGALAGGHFGTNAHRDLTAWAISTTGTTLVRPLLPEWVEIRRMETSRKTVH